MPISKRLSVTPYQKLVSEWNSCTRCPLHTHRKSVVFCRGSLPCDILLIGEAPGDSEDVLGKPFIGPGGKLLDELLREAEHEVFQCAPPDAKLVKFCFANLVGCIPKDDAGKGQPSAKEIAACSPRLDQIIKLAQPSTIVCVGDLVSKYAAKPTKEGTTWESLYGVKVFSIQHPVYLMKLDKAYRELAMQRAMINLVNAVQSVIPF